VNRRSFGQWWRPTLSDVPAVQLCLGSTSLPTRCALVHPQQGGSVNGKRVPLRADSLTFKNPMQWALVPAPTVGEYSVLRHTFACEDGQGQSKPPS